MVLHENDYNRMMHQSIIVIILKCHAMLQCYTVLVLHNVAQCHTMCYTMLQCYAMLHSVTQCYTVLCNVTVLHNVTQCYTNVTQCNHCHQQQQLGLWARFVCVLGLRPACPFPDTARLSGARCTPPLPCSSSSASLVRVQCRRVHHCWRSVLAAGPDSLPVWACGSW